jgi:uncharacterized membrane protein
MTAERPRTGRRRGTDVRALVASENLVLVGVLVLAAAVRLVAIGSNLSIDDGYSWLVGSSPSAHAFLHRLAASENTPPLFYLLLEPLPIGHPAWLRIPAAIPGILMSPVLYYALRRPLGARVALLAALGIAVAPLLVTYSNLARGFMLEDLALLVALWATLRLVCGGSSRWWGAYLVAGVVAVYTEYDSALFLLALTAAALIIGTRARVRTAILGLLPLLAIAPWIPEIVRGQNQVNITKLSPTFPGPSVTTLRDAAVTLTLGEYGGTSNHTGRWLVFAVLVVLVVAAALLLRRATRTADVSYRRAIGLIALTAALVLIAHAIAAALGFDVFNQRYLTIVIALAAALGAAALVSTERRYLIVGAGALLVAVGVVNLARRDHHQWQPSLEPVRAAAIALHPRTVLTNTPVVLYYLGSLRPILDRPFDLGPGRQQSCARPCLIIDDMSTHTGTPRPLPAPGTTLGYYELTLER